MRRSVYRKLQLQVRPSEMKAADFKAAQRRQMEKIADSACDALLMQIVQSMHQMKGDEIFALYQALNNIGYDRQERRYKKYGE